MQRSHIASVYIYIRHTLIARGRGGCIAAVSVVPIATCMYCACEMQKLRKKRSIQGKGTLPQKRVRQRRESLTD